MSISPLTLRANFWESFDIQEQDLEFLYNFLLEHETPQTSSELIEALLADHIRQEKDNLIKGQPAQGEIYLPKKHYQPGQTLLFPALEWKSGQVKDIRPGQNPEYPPFEVMGVDFGAGETHEFATGIENHLLNQPIAVKLDDPQFDVKQVFQHHGSRLTIQLNEMLEANPDLVRIAGRWFPRALLVDVNIGHLNLAEAVLDMSGGGPMTTHTLLEQIELPTDVNSKLTEFSLNLALQEDGRFDEVGPAGEILWFLHRLEPEQVQSIPLHLKFNPSAYDASQIQDLLPLIDPTSIDELEPYEPSLSNEDELVFSLIFPHWRTGSLPLTRKVARFFPTAYESPRVQFNFVDADNGQRFSGWVVRSARYVYGLKEWYTSQGLLPGSLVRIRKGKKPGEVIIKADKRRSTREWVRTALIGADGGIVFAMLKQIVTCAFDERMVIAINDLNALEKHWEPGGRSRQNLEQVILGMMRELSKLNTQGHVHFQELYSSVNLVRRCPPGFILNMLVSRPWANHLGDMYFRLDENKESNQHDE